VGAGGDDCLFFRHRFLQDLYCNKTECYPITISTYI
jgi:hypothetical protein